MTVNTVSPGYIGTDMVKAIRQDVLDKIIATVPVKRLGEPSEIASHHCLAGFGRGRIRHWRRIRRQRRPAHGLVTIQEIECVSEPAKAGFYVSRYCKTCSARIVYAGGSD